MLPSPVVPAHNSNENQQTAIHFASKKPPVFDLLIAGMSPACFKPCKSHENQNDSYFEVVHSPAGNRGVQRGRSSRSARHSSRREFLIKRKGQDVHEESREGRNDGSRDGKIG